MKNSLLKLMFVGLLTTTFVTSCSTNKSSNESKENVNQSDALLGKWELDYVQTNNGKTVLESFPEGAPYIDFISKDVVSAYDGCNMQNGGIEVKKNTISFGNLMSTMKACQNVDDRAFNSKLNGTLNYSVSNGVLTLIQGDIAVMKLVRPGQLNGTWVLEEFIGKDRSMKSLNDRFPNMKPTITFDNGTLSGSNGCNKISGQYTVAGESIKMGNIVSTRMFCDGVDEAPFNERLQAVSRFEIEKGKLVLYANGAKTMTFGNLIQPR